MSTDLVLSRRHEVAISPPVVPALVMASGRDPAMRFLEFFATQIENDNTRAAYLRAAREFLAWCDGKKVGLLADIHTAE
jgi:integrase/recombinase XerC